MKKRIRKSIAILLSVMMLVTMLPITAFAAETSETDVSKTDLLANETSEGIENNMMKSTEQLPEIQEYVVDGENDKSETDFDINTKVEIYSKDPDNRLGVTHIKSNSSVNGANYTSSAKLASELNNIFAGSIGLYSNSACTSSVSVPLGSTKLVSGTYYAGGVAGSQCYIYANAVYGKLFGGDYPFHGGYDFLSHSEVVLSKVTVQSGSQLYNLFKNANVMTGAYIRSTGNSDGSYNGGSGHSAIVLSYNESNITLLGANVDGLGTAMVSTYSWEEYANSRFINKSRRICHVTQPTSSYYESVYGVNSPPTPATHTIDTNYPTNFTATAKGHIDVFNSDHSDPGSYYIDEGDVCTIHEVYTDGCCKVTYPSSVSGTATYYAHISDFSYSIAPTYADIGTNFTAPILNKEHWKIIETDINDNGYIKTADEKGFANQLWYFERQSDGSYKISSCYDGKCLDVCDAGTSDGTNVWTCASNNTDAQRWYIYERNGGYVLKPKCADKVLDLNNNDPTNGSKIQLWTANESGAQVWAIYQGDECKLKPTTLSVAVGSSSTKTTFTWPDIYGERDYDLKIWKNKLYEGDAYHVEWGATSGYGIQLPAGTYQAYVDAVNYYDCMMSNTVTFTVANTTYTVSYNANGGSNAPGSQTKTYGTALTLSSTKPTRTGYTFKNWNTKADGTGTSYSAGGSYTANASVTLYAQWTPVTYSVAFNANGGTGTMSDLSCTYDTAKTLTANAFTRTGYTFNGWNTKADGSGTSYADKASVKNLTSTSGGKVTLYAQWKGYTYTVAFNANGGTGTMSDLSCTYGTAKALTANAFTRTGYTFNGWNTKADGSGTAYADKASVSNLTSTSGGKVTLYAQWKGYTYTVTFNANGGTGTMSDLSCTYGTAKTLTANAFTRTGYTFNGWNTKADGSGTAYADKASVSNLTSTSGGKVTLYAQWKGYTYTVAFNANGGTGTMSNLSCTYGTAKTLTANAFTRTGYTFNGWNTKADGSGTSYADKDSVSNLTSTNGATVTLYAKWKANTYTVTFNANGGTGTMSDLSCTYGTAKALTANAFTRTGYTFNGWNTKTDGSGTAYADKASVSNLTSTNGGKVTLYAQWKIITYTVSYNANGGSNVPGSQTKTYGTALTLSSTKPTRTGYTFKNWNTKADGSGTSYSAGDSYTANAAVTLYAQWTPVTYSVAFNANGGTGTMSNLSCTYGTAKTLTANAFTRTGYTFNGWNTKADGSGTSYADKTTVKNLTSTNGETVTLYAKWKANTYTVTFNANGGTGTMSDLSCIYATSTVLTANTFTRTGYAFSGWNTKADGSGTAYTDKASVKNLTSTNGGKVTLYAQWIANAYTVTFNANGGTNAPGSQAKIHDTALVLSTAEPTKVGYTFAGWNTKVDGSGTKYTAGGSYTANADVTLYAQWTANTYTIVVNANGGSGTMSNISCTYDVESALTANAFTRAGYIFAGWNTKADGTGTAYADKAKVKNLTTTNHASVTLYAQWILSGTEMKTGYDRVLPDGDYMILSYKNANMLLDIAGNAVPAPNGKNCQLWECSEKFRTEDVFTIKYDSSDKCYSILQKDTNMSLHVLNSSMEEGANVEIYQYDSSASERWAISTAYDDSGKFIGYRIQSKCNGFSLDITDGVTDTNGANIRMWKTSNTDAQSWLFVPYNAGQSIPEGKYILVSELKQTVELDVPGDTFEINNGVEMQVCNDNTSTFGINALSKFNALEVTYCEDGYYKLNLAGTDKKLTVESSSKENKASIQMWDDNDELGQLWAIIPYENGYVLVSRCGGQALTVDGGKTADGTKVKQEVFDFSNTQIWRFIPAEYTVKYDANGGSGTPSQQTKYYKGNLTLSNEKPVLGEYTFTGWNTKADGKGTSYSSGAVYSIDEDVTLYAQWKTVEFSVSPEITCEAGSSVTLSAAGGISYKFYYCLNGSWVRIRDFEKSGTCTWTPTKAGDYTLFCDVMDSNGDTLCKTIDYTVTEAERFTAQLKFAYPSPQKAGTTIKLTTSATGGKGKLKYKFYSECNGVWTKLWDYDTRDTYNWHATTVGTHTVYCDVMDEEGNVACAVVKYQIIAGEDFVADLNANRISGQLVGTEIRLLGGSSNGTGTVKYKFYYEIDGNWVRLSDFTTQDYFLWTPSKPGYYNLYMDAQDSMGNTASKRLCITIDEGETLKVTGLTANPTQGTKGSPVTLTAKITGGSGAVTYKFYYEMNGVWTRIQDFSAAKTCSFTPNKAGTYRIYVDAIDNTKNTQCLMINYTVK